MATHLPAEPVGEQVAKLTAAELPPGFLVPSAELAAALARFGVDDTPSPA